MFTKLYHKVSSQLALLSMFALAFAPANHAFAAECCPVNNDCCEQDDCCDPCGGGGFFGGKWGSLLGAAVLGAAAGAATGAAVSSSKHGHRGHNGATGATGATGAIGATGATGAAGTFANDGTTLTFDFAILAATVIGAGTIVPYVSEPDGTVIQGTPIAISPTLIGASPTITVSPALFGSYEAGVLFNGDGIGAGSLIDIHVDSSRDGSTTTIINAGVFTPLVGNQSETNVAFVYGAAPVP